MTFRKSGNVATHYYCFIAIQSDTCVNIAILPDTNLQVHTCMYCLACTNTCTQLDCWLHKPSVSKQALIIGRRWVARSHICRSAGVHIQPASRHWIAIHNRESWNVVVSLPRVRRRHWEVHVPLGLAIKIVKHHRRTARLHIEWRMGMSCQATSYVTYQQGMKIRLYNSRREGGFNDLSGHMTTAHQYKFLRDKNCFIINEDNKLRYRVFGFKATFDFHHNIVQM